MFWIEKTGWSKSMWASFCEPGITIELARARKADALVQHGGKCSSLLSVSRGASHRTERQQHSTLIIRRSLLCCHNLRRVSLRGFVLNSCLLLLFLGRICDVPESVIWGKGQDNEQGMEGLGWGGGRGRGNTADMMPKMFWLESGLGQVEG
jgi:hypothetical protein